MSQLFQPEVVACKPLVEGWQSLKGSLCGPGNSDGHWEIGVAWCKIDVEKSAHLVSSIGGEDDGEEGEEEEQEEDAEDEGDGSCQIISDRSARLDWK